MNETNKDDWMGSLAGFCVLLFLARIAYGSFMWLKDGTWYKIYGCQLIDLEKILCNPTSSWEGINKILNFLGTTDVLWFIVALFLIGFAILND